MSPGDDLAKIRALLDSKTDELSSRSELAAGTATDYTEIGRMFRGERRLLVKKMLDILDFLELSPVLALEVALGRGEVQPADVVRFFRGRCVAPDEFLQDIERRCLDLCNCCAQGRCGVSGRRETLLVWEEERNDDATAVKGYLEAEVERLFSAGEDQEVPLEVLADLAVALGIWASIQRGRRRWWDASQATICAFALAHRAGDDWTLGFVYQKGACLLSDLGQVARGISLSKAALVYFIEARDILFQAKVQIGLGVFHSYLGEYDKAINWLTLSLEQLPFGADNDRFTAHYDLACALCKLGRPNEALSHLCAAQALAPQRGKVEAYLYWTEGDLHLATRNFVEAASAYHKARTLLLGQGQGVDAVLISLDLARALLQLRDSRALAELGAELLAAKGAFEDNTAARDILERFALMCYRGKMSSGLLAEIRQELRAELPEHAGQLDQL